MPSLTFSVTPDGVARLHDLLSCLAKFDDDISIEATSNNVSNIMSAQLLSC